MKRLVFRGTIIRIGGGRAWRDVERFNSRRVVKISSFGSFTIRNKSERIGRNPKTGQEVPITPRRVVIFKPSHVLKSRILLEISK